MIHMVASAARINMFVKNSKWFVTCLGVTVTEAAKACYEVISITIITDTAIQKYGINTVDYQAIDIFIFQTVLYH